jgi:lysozyme
MNDTLHLSAEGIDLVKFSEGYRSRTYNDVAGFKTIGYGHRLILGETYPNGITLEYGERILAEDIADAEAAIRQLVKVELTQGQFDALVDFVFNLGSHRLAGSTLLRLLNDGDNDEAAHQLLRWDHAGSRELLALKLRRESEYKLWMGKAAA